MGFETNPAFALVHWTTRQRLCIVEYARDLDRERMAPPDRLCNFELSPHDPDLFMVCKPNLVTLHRWSEHASGGIVHQIRQPCHMARLSPVDPDLVAVCNRNILTVWRWSTHKCVTLTEHNDYRYIRSLAFSPNNADLIATANCDNVVHVWSISRRQSVAVLYVDRANVPDNARVESIEFVSRRLLERLDLTKSAR
mmetsp:Transcript_30683/g.72109  ORF Transcript_30683/g.72109 Transcript_30683/m.72109 type:complete len:196 (+) Transcript_30683:120-707(+)